jgi:Transposase DDE domain
MAGMRTQSLPFRLAERERRTAEQRGEAEVSPTRLPRSDVPPVAARSGGLPAAELVALYHARWALELGFDDVKTHTLERAHALRSKAPARVTQEVWGLALGYFSTGAADPVP